jgi:hypothetical protein
MPRERRQPKVPVGELRWENFFLTEHMDFHYGWRPARDADELARRMAHTNPLGLETWQEFLEVWLVVREDGLQAWREHQREVGEPEVRLPFAEFVLRAVEQNRDPDEAADEYRLIRGQEERRGEP